MKRARQAEILNIIQAVDVETQEQLLDELKARGFSATQATISRDIKELRLVKELSGGGYRYASSERKGLADSDARLRNIFKEGVTSVDRAQNIVVDHARTGLGGLLRPGQHGDPRHGGQPGRRRHGHPHHAGQRRGGALQPGGPQASEVTGREEEYSFAFPASH